MSLFSDPACKQLLGLWWLEGGTVDPFAFSSRTHDNPWSDYHHITPSVAGSRFRRTGVEHEELRERESVVMQWTQSKPSLWIPHS
jgi:hypothetical protein